MNATAPSMDNTNAPQDNARNNEPRPERSPRNERGNRPARGGERNDNPERNEPRGHGRRCSPISPQRERGRT
jgi:hypothetical protein